MRCWQHPTRHPLPAVRVHRAYSRARTYDTVRWQQQPLSRHCVAIRTCWDSGPSRSRSTWVDHSIAADAYTTFAHVDRAPTSREQSVAAPRWRVGASRRRTLRPPHTAREGHGTTPQNVPFEVRLRHTNPTRRFGTRTHRRPRSTSAHADMPSRPSGMSGLLSNQKNLMKLSRRTPLKTQKQSHTLTRVFGAS